ncbi:hypothetical protein A3A39_04425 [Candidatus Kaiserbacteria bacterium RIFCSPLOWO2_01_FULL_54_13]|uniref:DUF5673 domain-containing protein n=1 Tax=Candidatus Kaiserbacteria bacterium RIFCSPLOWO2_01_FULL_54_13 TaxID=1798512 RepID=A0A1F6F1J0_9BACT|nr:MAG: hypothetical protein A3A39_04425 [Candidatus Kaiserbacteria bacterium RIFCSPLOWO2_01_FULL_54_13]
MPTSSTPIRWRAYEHEHVERSRDWYWALGIFAASTALISVLFGNFLFGILILIAAATLGLLAQSPPPLVEFEISDRGIRVGGVMHRYEEIISFWVEDHDADPPILLVDTIKWLSPNLVIPLRDVDPKLVRAFLTERADEVPMKEPIWHHILEAFGL